MLGKPPRCFLVFQKKHGCHEEGIFERKLTEKRAKCKEGGDGSPPPLNHRPPPGRCRPSVLPHPLRFYCLLTIPFLLTTVVMHWKREAKSHYISSAAAVAAESHYSSLTVSKGAAELVFARHPAASAAPPCTTRRKLPHTSAGRR